MPRFYCNQALPPSGSVELTPDAAHHAARVLRLREGDAVEIFDGMGNERRGQITLISGKRVVIGILAATNANRESSLQVLIAQALTSSEKMDWVIQKSTELGVTEIQPLDTERSVARLSPERIAKRLEHWQQVAISACEQCGRNTLPQIYAPLDIMMWLQQIREKNSRKYILLPDGERSFTNQTDPHGGVLLLIGAEGGFTPAERSAAKQSGFESIRMGSRVMRTETAAIAGLAAVQTLWGDFQ